MKSFDYAIIGAGPGGYVSAIRAGQLGLNTVLIEKDDALGGTCLNVGCIPSKALLESSEMYFSTKHKWSEHGLAAENIRFDLATMLARKETVVKTLTDGVATLMKKYKVTVMKGFGKLAGDGKIDVESDGNVETIEAKTIVLAMGSISVELPFMKFDGENIVSSTEALSFTSVPEHLIIVGAGAIGLEMGSVWNRLGSKVSVVEMLPQVTPFADKQMATMLQRSLKSQGFNFYLGAKVTGAELTDGMLELSFENKKGEIEKLIGDKVLVAVGRKPNSAGCNLDKIGVSTERNGMVIVDDQWRTNVEGVYAIGDLVQGPMLAHKAEEEGVAVAEIAAGMTGHVNFDAIPNVVYTHPELAVVGLSEEQLKEQGRAYNSGKCFFRGNGRALSMGETDGLVKILADKETDEILGAHILGAHASDMIAELAVAVEFKATAEQIARTCHAHPTLSEVIKEAALAVGNRSIHG